MNLQIRSLVVWTILFPIVGAVAQDAVPQVIAKRIDAAVADMIHGRSGEAHQKLQFILEQGGAADFKAADEYLDRLGIKQPLGELVADLRVETVVGSTGNIGRLLKPIGPAEAKFVLSATQKRIADLLQPIDKELEIGFRLDAAHVALDEQFDRLVVLNDQIEVVDRLTTLQADAAKAFKGQARKNLSVEANEALGKNFRQEGQENKKRSVELISRIVEISIVRIADMLEQLRDTSGKYDDRVQSVARLENAFATLKYFWPTYRGAKKTKGKSVGGKSVGQNEILIKEQEKEFSKLAGTLRLKVYHFEQGKLWWLRGRWGLGPYHNGLTKAVAGPKSLEAFLYYPLAMPDPIPKPSDPLKDPRPLPLARRHLEVWKVTFPAGDMNNRLAKNLRVSKLAWRLMLLPPGEPSWQLKRVLEDDYEFNAIVGFLEYQMALLHWNKLLELASEAEIVGLEKSIAADDRFVIHSYLSRKYDSFDPRSTLRLEPPKSDDPRASDIYERRGLSWCMALAKVELGAIRALYTGFENELQPIQHDKFNFEGANPATDLNADMSKLRKVRPMRNVRPFDACIPNAFDRTQVAEVLWDGMRQQYYNCGGQNAGGGGQGQVVEVAPNSLLMRNCVALEFIRAYQEKYRSALSGIQIDELRNWENQVDNRIARFAYLNARLAGWYQGQQNSFPPVPDPSKKMNPKKE